MTGKLRQVLVLCGVMVASAAAGEESYTRFLLPFYSHPIPGAGGSVWEVQTSVYNGTDRPVTVVPVQCVIIVCPGGISVTPDSSPLPLRPQENVATGFFMAVHTPNPAGIWFQSRIRDRSKTLDSAGTEVPVVREDHFSPDTLALLDIPLSQQRFRTMLRIYSLPEAASPREVEVRYYSMPSFENPEEGPDYKVLLRSERVVLHTPGAGARGPAFYAAYAQVASLELIDELVFDDAIWIEVVPRSPGLRIWAFVSITNNVTHQVTLVTPTQH